jgi:GMP synthase-like glutamine amidotransferase
MKHRIAVSETVFRDQVFQLIGNMEIEKDKARKADLQNFIIHLLKVMKVHRDKDVLAAYATAFKCTPAELAHCIRYSTNPVLLVKAENWLNEHVPVVQVDGESGTEDPS